MQKKSIIFNKKGIPNTHFFVYKNQNYPFKFDFFKHSSKYFSENKKQLKQNKYIPLIKDEEATTSDFKPEWITDFINFVQCQEITLDTSNVLCLNYLSNIYDIDALQTITNEYISTNENDLVIQILIKHQNDSKFKTSKYEDIISSDIDRYIENDDLLQINVQILQRVFKKFSIQNKPLEKEQYDKILIFLMKCLDNLGTLASVLFSCVEIVKSSPAVLDRFMNSYSNVFNFNFLNKNDFINLYGELKKHESENEKSQAKVSEVESNIKQLEKDKEKLKEENEKFKNVIKQYEDERVDQCNREASLKSEINKKNDEIENLKSKIREFEQKEKEQNRGVLFAPNNSNFNGIINHLRNQSNSIDFTASSVYQNSRKDCLPINVTKFEDFKNAFLSEDKPGSWICLDFKEHRIIPTDYTLKSTTSYWFSSHPRNWIFEGSVDNDKWIPLDEQKDCQELHGKNLTHTFKVQNQSSTEFRYVRIRSTGPNWNGNNYLLIDSIEIYGKLIYISCYFLL